MLKLLFFFGVLAGIGVLLAESGVSSEDMDTYKWPFVIAGTILFFVVTALRKGGEKVCAWCGSSKLKFSSGEEGKRFWKYRNKDGSRDKRVKDNVELASYTRKYDCKKCNAHTSFEHFVDPNPSQNVKIWKRVLLKEGEGEKTGSNWENDKAASVNSSGENRKGK